MRLQPPKNENEFIGKDTHSDLELVISYIGSHRLLYKDGEITVDKYLESNEWFNELHIKGFISMFPSEIQHLAEIYLEHVLRHRLVP